MDWMNRGNRPAQSNTPAAPQAAADYGRAGKNHKERNGGPLKTLSMILVVVIVLAAAGLAVFFGPNMAGSNEKKLVDTKKMQAVFLNGGQVYFGSIKDLNDKFLKMDNIYYLRVNQQVQPNQSNNNNNTQNDISLVKLGCELHGPQDQMVINREQIIFWENLKEDGQVAKAVADYVKANPNGQKCETTTSSNSNSSNTNNNSSSSNNSSSTNKDKN